MGNVVVKCLKCNSEPKLDEETRNVIEAYVAAYAAAKKEKDINKNMEKLIKNV